MQYSSHMTTATDSTEQSIAFEKMLVSDLIAEWPAETPFDASAILAEHPELREQRSVVLDLAYEEYCRRVERGEKLSAQLFVSRFRDVQRSLLCLIDVHQMLHENPQFMAESMEPEWPKIGENFLDLELTASLGRGAFARVFLAREAGIGGRLVVSKLSKSGGREAEFLGRLEHPQIVPIFSIKHDEASGLSAICMPYLGRTTLLDLIDGIASGNTLPKTAESLLQIIRSVDQTASTPATQPKSIRAAWNRTSIDALIDLGIQLSEGLEYAHKHQICHGDIKPSNVLITPQGHAMLMDFNLSFQTEGDDKALGGTLPYMAPEQLQRVVARQVGGLSASNEQTDLFGLGVVMYELFAGKYPFGTLPVDEPQRDAAKNLLDRQRSEFRPLRELNSRVDRHLAACIEKCLALDPSQRWQSAAELRAALEFASSFPQRSSRWIGEHRKAVVATAVAASLALSLSFAGPNHTSATPPPSEPTPPLELSAEDLREKGKRAIAEERYTEAIQFLNRFLDQDTADFEGHFLLGRAYLGTQQDQEAYDEFLFCTEINPEDDQAIELLSFSLAKVALSKDRAGGQQSQDLWDAINHATRGLGGAHDSDAALHNNIGFCHMVRDNNLSKARTHLEASLAADPDHPISIFNMLVLEVLDMRNSDLKSPPPILSEALSHHTDNPEVLFEAACLYARLATANEGSKVFTETYQQKCLGYLNKAVSAGFPLKQHSSRVESYYPALKTIPEFQNLLDEQPVQSPPPKLDRLIDPMQVSTRVPLRLFAER